MLPLVYFRGTPMPMYFLMGLAGFVFAFVLLVLKRRAFALSVRDIRRMAFHAAIGILLGARLFRAVGQIIGHGGEPHFWTAKHWLWILSGGGVFYGGLLCSIGLLYWMAKRHGLAPKSVFNAFAYASPAFLMFGRVGCYCAGCCYGITLASGARLPVQLFEAGFCAVVLLAFLVLRPERRWPALPLFPAFTVIYAVGRFALEFFRGDENRGVFLLSTSQWISVILIGVVLAYLYKHGKIRKKGVR